MADKKISELTALTGAASAANDVLPIVDTSATETKKITRDELAIALGVDQKLSSVSVDGTTIAGNGTSGNPLKQKFTFEVRSVSGNVNLAKPTTNVLQIEGTPDEIRSLGAPSAGEIDRVTIYFINISTTPVIKNAFIGSGSAGIVCPRNNDFQCAEYLAMTLQYNFNINQWVVVDTTARLGGYSDGSTITGAGTFTDPFVAAGGVPSGVDGSILQFNGGGVLTARTLLSYTTGEDMWDVEFMNFFYKNGNVAIHYDDSDGVLLSDEDGFEGLQISTANRNLLNSFEDTVLDFLGAVPVAPAGLIVGVDTLGPEVLKVASDSGQILADFCQAQNDTTAMLTYSCFSGGTKNTVFEQNFYGLGNSSGRGSYNNFAGTDYDLAYSWDGSDYLTYLRNHRLVLGGNNGGYINKAFLDAIAGKIVQVAEGDSGLNPYIRSVVLNSGTSVLSIYDRVVDENSVEFQNIHYLKGSGNGVLGGYTVPFQGWLNQQKILTDDTDTGWGFQFANEAFSRFQVSGDGTYQMQHKNSSGDVIFGLRNGRPVFWSGAVVAAGTYATPAGQIEIRDETGGTFGININS